MGQTPAQTPQPMQSSGEMASVNFMPGNFLAGVRSSSLMPSGAAAASASSSANGRMAACGQTLAQLLHWMQAAASHVGTKAATPRFSYAEAPSSNWPSAMSLNAETGRLSPSMRSIGCRSFLTCSTIAALPSRVRSTGSSTASFQDSGTSTTWNAVAPASMAFQLASTMAWPFLA